MLSASPCCGITPDTFAIEISRLCGELLRAWSSSLKRETAEAYVVVATFPDAPEQGCLAASLAGMGRRAGEYGRISGTYDIWTIGEGL
jgi:hypothetical protein